MVARLPFLQHIRYIYIHPMWRPPHHSHTQKPSMEFEQSRGVPWAAAFDAIRSGDLKRSAQFKSDRFDPASQAKAAPAVIESLNANEAVFAELRAASRRPHSRYPVVYDLENPWGILLPHLAKIKATCQRLQLRACAELAAGQTTNAVEDVKLLLEVTDSLKEEPFLISYLVRIACVQIAHQPIWEGLAEHRWSEAQLVQLQSRLERYDLVADMSRPLGAEQAAGILTADLIRNKGLAYMSDLSSPDSLTPASRATANLIGYLIPRGWYYQEQLNYCRFFHAQFGASLGRPRRQVSPSETEASAREIERAIAGSTAAMIFHHHVIARMLLPTSNKPNREWADKIPRTSAAAQITTDQAVLACALERYRLANGEFPDQLEALTPRFIAKLPDDVLTGAPYKYRRTEDGQFVLYSVGWDEKDDGGVPGKTLFDEKQGDWVWSYPSK